MCPGPAAPSWNSKCLAGDWDGALAILEAQKNTRLVDRDESKRMRAVLLTAKAMTLSERDPAGAKTAGLEAQKLAPDLPPAALVAAEALFRMGDLRRGSKVLETSWISQPHPDIAEAYVNARPGDSPEDRLKRARKLHGLHSGAEAEMCLARAALDAGEFDLARKSALAAADTEPRESTYLLLADIEEAQTGEVGRVREWLGRAIRAPRDPAWTADGVVSRNWAPISPITGRIDAFEWKVPVERIGDADGPMIDADEPEEDRGPARTIGASPVPASSQTPTPAVTPPATGETAKPMAPEKPEPTAKPAANPTGATAATAQPAANDARDATRPSEPRQPEAVDPPKETKPAPTSKERKEARFG